MELGQTVHITQTVNGFIIDIDGDEKKTAVFQRENADEMFEHLAKMLDVYNLIYLPSPSSQPDKGDTEQKTPAHFTITDPDI